MDEQHEVEENLEADLIQDEPIPEKPIWGKLENCLSGCLVMILLIILPFLFYGLIEILPEGDEPALPQKTRIAIRQGALEENWARYLGRANDSGVQIQTENFELVLCPFVEDNGWRWDEYPEEVGYICGYVTVPLDHAQPDGAVIQIPIAIWPSDEEGAQSDPLFITHGGPGASALEMYPDYLYPDRMGGKRDLVFIDQRGTQYARPNLICPEVTVDINGALNPNLETNDEYDFQKELNYCRARMMGKGVNLSAFTSMQIAHDFEVVWQTLGYEQINFYGVSYGSHVGQYLAAYYPDQIRSLILDGVAPVPLDYLNSTVTSKSRMFSEIISNCNQDPYCAENYPNLSSRFSSLINSLDQDPVKVNLGSDYYFYPLEVDGEFFFNYLFSLSYLEKNYALLPYIIKEAEENRFDYFKVWVDWRLSEIQERSLAYYSVICSEHQPFLSSTEFLTNLGIPLISWEKSGLDEMEQTCQTLGIENTPDKLDLLPESPLPALLLSGHFDPITPPEYGEIALESFPNGQHLVDPIGSHGIAFTDDCLDSALDQFLADPLRKVDQSCLENPERRNQVVPSSALSSLFMLPKKEIPDALISFGSLLLILIGMGLGLSGLKWLVSKIKKNQHPLPIKDKVLRWGYGIFISVFALSCFGLGYALSEYNANFRPFIYKYALALPEDVRYLLLIPPLLLLMMGVVAYFSIRVWKNDPSVLKRLYLLVNFALVLTILGTITFNGMLWVWVR